MVSDDYVFLLSALAWITQVGCLSTLLYLSLGFISYQLSMN
jgi:hypothetical protein